MIFMKDLFDARYEAVKIAHEDLINKKNKPVLPGNGIFERYKNPVVTAEHIPIHWRYDLDRESNPFFMERFGINGTFNAGAIKWNGKYLLVVRVEGNDRKSFFAIAESSNGIDGFRFWDSRSLLMKLKTPIPMYMICV